MATICPRMRLSSRWTLRDPLTIQSLVVSTYNLSLALYSWRKCNGSAIHGLRAEIEGESLRLDGRHSGDSLAGDFDWYGGIGGGEGQREGGFVLRCDPVASSLAPAIVEPVLTDRASA